jgi:hypothetical protein
LAIAVRKLSVLYRQPSQRISADAVKPPKEKEKNNANNENVPASETPVGPILRRAATDACDLFIPGSVTGWLKTPPVVVGVASITSSLISSKDIWARVNRNLS